jgi:prophage regulatory protein
MHKKLIKLNTVISLTCLSRSHVYALAQQNNFPKPVKLSERSSAWVENEINEWVQSRIDARDTEELS